MRFANGTTTSRPASVIVNGATVQTSSFEGTGAWATWVTKTLTVSVNAGSNTIRFSPTTSNGLPNVDFLDFEVAGIPPGNAMAVVAAMQPGWNLGNSLDSTGADETSWGNPRITQSLINNVKAQGFKSIRIPVTWGQHQGSAPSYTIEAAYLNRVKEVVDWALAADLYVMVNIHHDSWQWVANNRHTGTIEQGEKLKFFEYLGFYARTKRITTMLWDNGQHFGRTSFQWSDPELFGQIRSSWTTRSGTASSDQVFNVRASSITAKTITLNLNGTSFLGLRQGSTDLAPGSDYTVSGDQLTLTAAALTRLSGNRAYGVNATVHARFSQGVPWRINIVTFDPPVMQNASGTTSSFAIPTTFRGDTLATMEARYADGSNAGPHNWTSFKEFDVTFAPNYSSNTITLTSTFFNEVTNGARVTLTFHFWSGTRVTYFVTKSASSVTGTTS